MLHVICLPTHTVVSSLDRGTGIIIGASSIDQLNQNLTAIEGGPLPDDVVQACEIAWAGIKGSAPAYWAGKYAYTYDTLEALYGEEAL
jgi:aflatoxin B1 aldehyde reductase